MNDSPTHPSILMRNPVICTHGLGALELLLRDRDDVDDARLQRHREGPADGRESSRDTRYPGTTTKASDAEARSESQASAHHHTVRRAHVDAAADLVADFQRALWRFVFLGPGHRAVEQTADLVLTRRDRGRQRRDHHLRFVLGRHVQRPAVGRLRGRRRGRFDETLDHRRSGGIGWRGGGRLDGRGVDDRARPPGRPTPAGRSGCTPPRRWPTA